MGDYADRNMTAREVYREGERRAIERALREANREAVSSVKMLRNLFWLGVIVAAALASCALEAWKP